MSKITFSDVSGELWRKWVFRITGPIHPVNPYQWINLKKYIFSLTELCIIAYLEK